MKIIIFPLGNRNFMYISVRYKHLTKVNQNSCHGNKTRLNSIATLFLVRKVCKILIHSISWSWRIRAKNFTCSYVVLKAIIISRYSFLKLQRSTETMWHSATKDFYSFCNYFKEKSKNARASMQPLKYYCVFTKTLFKYRLDNWPKTQ